MNGYRHLLTPDDLNKAASLCTSLKGTLQSKFLVLSDDHDPPPPPNRGKRNHPGDDAPNLQETSKRLHKTQSRARAQGQRSTQQVATADINPAAPVSSPSYKVVESKAARKRRNGPPPGRVTPSRLAKTGKAPSVQPEVGPDSELIEVDVDVDVNIDNDQEMSQEDSASEDDSGGSSKTVVDWVRLLNTFLNELIVCLLRPLSTIDSLSTTEATSLRGSLIGRSIERSLLIISP